MQIESLIYPNGQPYKMIKCKGEVVGCYDVLPHGYLPQNCRKVLADERAAQLKVIQRYINEHLKLAAQAAELYKEFN